ncbi:pantetheinase [Nephila pilipes]|uniref:Pantetheinase n=1 Tax=Nephila pilipes TaxID=299642 RepID=A0A8X6NHK3_NEPPI|nr:pantetheinase [Nephila pilipes]
MESSNAKWLLFFTVLFMVDISLSADESSYRAAVFEIVQFQFDDSSYSGEDVINKNLEKYGKAAEVAANNEVDIIVFPEEGLYSPNINNETWFISYGEDIPDPRTESVNPCNQEEYENRPVLKNLSCLAQKHGFYVVADEVDVKKCEVKDSCDENNVDYCVTNADDCPKGGNFNFNTAIIFDRKGNLVARYYKRYLYFEEGISFPKKFRNVYFDTDFGKFTVDICFDSLFYDSVEGIENHNVTSLAFPTFWYDHTPLVFFATPFQQSWSITNKVNVIAADVHDPRTGSLGSGIYSSDRGALVYTHNPDGRSKLLISNVPKTPSHYSQDIDYDPDTKFYYLDDDEVTELEGEEPRNFEKECGFNVLGDSTSSLTDYRCSQTEVHQYKFLKITKRFGRHKICSKGFCCTLTYTTEKINENYYFGISGKPLNFYDTYLLGTQACFIARCDPFKGQACGNSILKSQTVFKTVILKGSFKTKYIYPYAINSDIRLIDKKEWSFDGKSKIIYVNSKNDSLLFLGLYGRVYEEDKSLNK